MLKASMGGGGKGMRLIHSAEEVEEAYTTAVSYTHLDVYKRQALHGAGHLTHGHDLIFQRFIGKQFFFSLFCQRA